MKNKGALNGDEKLKAVISILLILFVVIILVAQILIIIRLNDAKLKLIASSTLIPPLIAQALIVISSVLPFFSFFQKVYQEKGGEDKKKKSEVKEREGEKKDGDEDDEDEKCEMLKHKWDLYSVCGYPGQKENLLRYLGRDELRRLGDCNIVGKSDAADWNQTVSASISVVAIGEFGAVEATGTVLASANGNCKKFFLFETTKSRCTFHRHRHYLSPTQNVPRYNRSTSHFPKCSGKSMLSAGLNNTLHTVRQQL